jgi:hypothetical protein
MPDFTGEEGLGRGLAFMGTERRNSFGVVGGGACAQGRLVGLATLVWMIKTLRVFWDKRVIRRTHPPIVEWFRFRAG